MNYKKIYDDLISRAKKRVILKYVYVEKHHIEPKCICPGKTKDKNNIVKLYAREHFIAHLLLCRIYPHENKLFYAVIRMLNTKKYKHVRNNKYYEHLRKIASKSLKGQNNPNYNNHKLSGKNHPNYGKKFSEETKRKIGIKSKGRVWPEESKKRLSVLMKGQKNHFYGKQHTQLTRNKISKNHINVSGESNPNTKLTWDIVNEIRRLHKNNNSIKSLCQTFKICESTLKKIIYYTTWKVEEKLI